MVILNKKSIIKIIIYVIIVAGILSAIVLFKTNKTQIQTTSANVSKNKYEILVDVEESVLYLFQDGSVIKTYPCSGGKWSTPSPIGEWKIIQKATWGEGFRTVDGWA